MKRALILHGTGANHTANWFPWLQHELTARGYEVWVPDLPLATNPSARRYTDFLLNGRPGWSWDNQTIIIGHSSGAVEILALLQALPPNTQVGACFLVAVFTQALAQDPAWTMLEGLFDRPFDYPLIKSRSGRFVVIHSDNDPFIPLDQPREIANHLGTELVIIPGKQHFSASLDSSLVSLPELMPLL